MIFIFTSFFPVLSNKYIFFSSERSFFIFSIGQRILNRSFRLFGVTNKLSTEGKFLRSIKSNLVYFRYCPANMFILDGFVRIIHVLLVAYVANEVDITSQGYVTNPFVVVLMILSLGTYKMAIITD